MTAEDRKLLQKQQEARILRYQHQHRGLRFLKLFLPPVTDIKVNLVGSNNHIYKGSIPSIPADQLPSGFEKSLDEEALYKEIRDMNFPAVPKQQPLGPSRRIGGEYTLTKRIALEPVEVNYREGLHETLILGKDGNLYKGTEKYPSKIKLDKKLSGTKKIFEKVRCPSSSRGFIEPTLVSLPTNQSGKYYKTISLIEMPRNNIEKVNSLLASQNLRKKKVTIEEPDKDKDRQENEHSDGSESLSQSEAMDETSTNMSNYAIQEPEQSQESTDESEKNISQETKSSDESESLSQNEETDETSSIDSSDTAQETEQAKESIEESGED